MYNKLSTLQQRIIQFIDFFHQPFQKFIPCDVFRYAACGGGNTLFDILLYFLVYQYLLQGSVIHLGLFAISGHIAAFLIVFPITFITGFLLGRYITFTESDIRGRTQLIRYGLTVSGSILLNYLLLKLFVEYFTFSAPIAKIFTTIIVVLYSFFAQKYFTFRTHPQTEIA